MHGRFESEIWLTTRISQRTAHEILLWLATPLPQKPRKPLPEPRYRNPVIYAKELASRLVEEGISQAELARRLGVSRARVCQWLRLLELPEEALREVEDLGDYWNRRMITERELRVLRTADTATGGQPS
jgi:hypothetical protein